MTIQELKTILISNLQSIVMESCIIFDGSITSWGRTQKRNLALGGSPTSWHLDFLAFDVILDDVAKSGAFQEYIRDRKLRVIQTGGQVISKSFHIQYPWPIEIHFEREDQFTHLKLILSKYSFLFRDVPFQIVKTDVHAPHENQRN